MNKMRLGTEYIPLTNEETLRFRVFIPFSKIAWATVSLPFFGFIFCIVWSVIYNFEHATNTHCKVYNFLPSVSAAIGNYKPQSDVWKAVIATQAVIRLLVLLMYYKHYKNTLYTWAQGIGNMALLTYSIENTALVTLSFWTSNENYVFHKLSFITFLIMAFMHMLLACLIMNSCQSPTKDALEAHSLKWKLRLTLLNVISILLACYFFYRHNKYCEPLVYSMFALTEYMVVLTNMGFHMTAAWDFAGKGLLISTNGIRIV